MDVVSLGSTPEGFPVVLDKHAARGRPHRRRRPRQAAHQLSRPHRKRPAEDDDDRPGQARRRPGLPPHPAGTALRPGRPLRRAASCAPSAPIAFGLALVENAYDETALVEAVLPGRLRAARGGAAGHGPAMAAAAAVSPGRPADRRRDRQGHQRLRHGHQRRRPQAGFANRPPENQPNMRFIFVRGLSSKRTATPPASAWPTSPSALVQAMNYEATVINCLTAGYPDERQPAGPLRHRPRGHRRRPGHPRHTPAEKARILHIRNTLCLEELKCPSRACKSCRK